MKKTLLLLSTLLFFSHVILAGVIPDCSPQSNCKMPCHDPGVPCGVIVSSPCCCDIQPISTSSVGFEAMDSLPSRTASKRSGGEMPLGSVALAGRPFQGGPRLAASLDHFLEHGSSIPLFLLNASILR